MKIQDNKNDVLYFWNAPSVMFLDYPNYSFLRVFLVFITKERPILTVLKQIILDEIKQSNGIKPQKINFFMIFCKFLPHTGTFWWKVPSKNIYTFYLKHQKYPFCAPIFHPLSDT